MYRMKSSQSFGLFPRLPISLIHSLGSKNLKSPTNLFQILSFSSHEKTKLVQTSLTFYFKCACIGVTDFAEFIPQPLDINRHFLFSYFAV